MLQIPTNATQIYQLSMLRLPTLPTGTTFLMKSLMDPEIEFIEMAGVIEKFPSIAGKLISLANSVWSAPVCEITSLEAACSRLGFGVVRSTSIALAIAAPFDSAKCPAFDTETFWCSALLAAETASELALAARCIDKPEPSTARAAGMLHNLGLLWLADRLPDEANRVLTMCETEQAQTLPHALRQILGFDNAQAGSQLADAWELPEPLAMAMTHYQDIDYCGPQAAIVNIVGLATRSVSSILRSAPCPEPDTRLNYLGISTEAYNDIYSRTCEQLTKVRAAAHIFV